MKRPTVLDQTDRRTLGRMAVYLVYLVAAVSVLALTLGMAVRLFLLAAFGG